MIGFEPGMRPIMLPPFARPRWASAALWLAAAGTLVAVTVVSFVVFTGPHPPRERAIVAMGAGLVVIWCGLGGLLQWRYRETIVRWIQRIPGGPRTQFVIACTGLALIEEVVATAMTNLAPAFGVAPAAAFITTSTNWLHNVTLHSVVVFVPMFAVWAVLVSRRRFHPAEVLVMVGLNGLLAEWFTFGQLNPIWLFVYGLMAWLPAWATAERLGNGRPRPRWGTFLLALVGPLVAAAPVAGVMQWAHPAGLVDFRQTPPNG